MKQTAVLTNGLVRAEVTVHAPAQGNGKFHPVKLTLNDRNESNDYVPPRCVSQCSGIPAVLYLKVQRWRIKGEFSPPRNSFPKKTKEKKWADSPLPGGGSANSSGHANCCPCPHAPSVHLGEWK